MESCDLTPLVAYDEALQQLVAAVRPVTGVRDAELRLVRGAVLAEDIIAPINVPGCAVSSMDGYAVNCKDISVEGETRLPVSQRIPAGHPAAPLDFGSAARLFTGAPIPTGADAVVMQEQVIADGDFAIFSAQPTPGANIRPVGNDIVQGATILRAGHRLRAQDLGLAASVGLCTLPVRKPLRVGIFFTGDELVESGQRIEPYQIFDSNRYTLNAFLETLGCEIVDLGIVGDTREATLDAMRRSASLADLVITSGGVSVGDEDHVRIAIETLGELRLWRLGIKPGKPLAFGRIDGTHFVGLPGNPVSVFVTFCLFVCPLIRLMQGRHWEKPLPFEVEAGFDWPRPDSRREFLRARLVAVAEGRVVAEIFPKQDSGILTSTVWADGLIEVPENYRIKRGDRVKYLAFSQFVD